jgi:hypothetical protein
MLAVGFSPDLYTLLGGRVRNFGRHLIFLKNNLYFFMKFETIGNRFDSIPAWLKKLQMSLLALTSRMRGATGVCPRW